jgi:hypothetical protein
MRCTPDSSGFLDQLSAGRERQIEMKLVVNQRVEAVLQVEFPCLRGLGPDLDRYDPDVIGNRDGPVYCVIEKCTAEAPALHGATRREPAEMSDRDRVAWETSPEIVRRIFELHATGRQRIESNDTGATVLNRHIRAPDTAFLVLTGVPL